MLFAFNNALHMNRRLLFFPLVFPYALFGKYEDFISLKNDLHSQWFSEEKSFFFSENALDNKLDIP